MHRRETVDFVEEDEQGLWEGFLEEEAELAFGFAVSSEEAVCALAHEEGYMRMRERAGGKVTYIYLCC